MRFLTFLVLVAGCLATARSFAPTSSLPFKNVHRGGREGVVAARTISPLIQAISDSDSNEVAGSSIPARDTSEWTPKASHNSALARSAAILLTLALAGASNRAPLARISTKAAAALHLFSFSTWFGAVVYTTFIAGVTMFQNLPRQTFGRLQGELFPKYFSLCSTSVLLQLITLRTLPLGQKAFTGLTVALVSTLLNQFILEPTSSKIMEERYQLEELPGGKDSEKYKSLASNFGRYHGISSLLNLIALCAGVAHGTYLATAIIAI